MLRGHTELTLAVTFPGDLPPCQELAVAPPPRAPTVLFSLPPPEYFCLVSQLCRWEGAGEEGGGSQDSLAPGAEGR